MGRRVGAVRLRVSARRPASWLALAGTAAATWCIAGRAEGSWPALAIAAGAIGGAVALGSVPRDGDAAWAAWRAAWPVAGGLIGWLASGAALATGAVPAAVTTACSATVVAVVAASRSGCAPADAAGCGLAAGLGAAAAAAGCQASSSPNFAWPLVAAACFGLVTAAVRRLRRRAAEAVARPRGPLAGAVPGVAMASALVAMVVFLFLAPHVAWGYAAVAAAWLLVVVVPRAALGPGCDGERERRALMTTAGRRGRPEVSAARLMAAYTAVLVWPPLVAAVLGGSAGATAPALVIAAAIATLAGVLAVLTCGALAAGCSRDTAHALALCAAVVAATGLAASGRAPAIPARGLMLSNPADPATLPESRTEPRLRQSPRGVVSCPASPSPASCRPSESRRRSCC